MPSGTSSTSGASAKAYGVDASRSSISFVTTKAGAAGVGGVSEAMRFSRYTGGMDASGKVTLAIDLASVDSGFEIRDERMRTMLWNVKATPQAVFTAQLPAEALSKVGAGSQNIEVTGQLQLAGQSKPITASLNVTNAGDGQILVSTRQPIVINSNDYGLRAGVEALREVMGLNFLASSAPVSLNLALKAI
jgi:polyisoprenoid-binding protein YceI